MGYCTFPLDEIDEGRLQALIDAGATKGRSIDYERPTLPRIELQRDLYKRSDSSERTGFSGRGDGVLPRQPRRSKLPPGQTSPHAPHIRFTMLRKAGHRHNLMTLPDMPAFRYKLLHSVN
jgi:hypothetical protein